MDSVAPTVNLASNPPAASDPKGEDPYRHIHSLTRALECAGSAVEECPKDVRYWHLLGLLLTATENWSGAREVLDRGEELNALTTETASQSAGDSSDGENDDDEDSQEDVESGEAFVVVGATAQPEAKNGDMGRPKHKRSTSTIMGNGSGSNGHLFLQPDADHGVRSKRKSSTTSNVTARISASIVSPQSQP